MTIALTILLIAFCIQGLVKFAVGFLVPYDTRIKRISSYYERDGRIISIYDSVTLAIIMVLVVLLFLTDMQELSFITGLIVGMLVIQIFFHRFSRPLAPEQGTRITTSPTETHVICDSGPSRSGLAGDRLDDLLVRLGALCAHPELVAQH